MTTNTNPVPPRYVYGNTGISRCRHCHKTNPWRSDFKYTVATGTPADHSRNTAVYPGFLGACRHCGKRAFQDVVQLADTLEEATAAADPVLEGGEDGNGSKNIAE